MNPFSNLGKPLPGTWMPANSQSVNYSPHHPTNPSERPKSTAPYTLPDLHHAATADTKNLARPPPSYESYINPNKRVRHNPLEYSEVPRESLTIPNQIRPGGRLDEQLQAQLQQHGKKLGDESFIPQHPAMRKLQSNLPFGLDNNAFGKGPGNSGNILLKQQLDKQKKESGIPENPRGGAQAPFNFPNEGLYNPLANNYNTNLTNLLLNYQNNPVLDLLQQQYQAKMQQLNNYVQLTQLSQLLGQQDPLKSNNILRNSNVNDPNNPLIRIPPLDPQTLLSFLTASSATPSNLGSLFRPDSAEKPRESLGHGEGLRNLVQKSNLEKMEAFNANKKDHAKMEELTRFEMKAEDQAKGDEFQYKPSAIMIPDDVNMAELAAAQRRKNNQLQQRTTNTVQYLKEPRDSRRKNKWQMMLEQDEGVENPLKLGPFEKLGKSAKLLRAEKRGLLGLSAPTDVENYEDLQGTLEVGGGRLFSSVQRKKKGENFSRNNARYRNSQGKNQFLTESQLYQGTYLNFNSLNDSDERGVNRMSITSSYGRSIEELTMDPNDQKTVDTRSGPEYQTAIVDLDLNASGSQCRRVPKQVWDPEAVDEKALAAYFEKLQAILNCKGINEEKAIRMLVKKNMIQEEVIVTIKKNEKFYSSFLGVTHADKHQKHKKGR